MRKTRRGRKKKSKNEEFFDYGTFNVLQTNIQASSLRKSSLQAIVNNLEIDLVIVNETGLRKNNKFNLDGFTSFSKNRQNAPTGGIATCINDKYSVDTMKTSEGPKEEFIITRHGQFEPALNVINLYGSQESRLTVDEIKENWETILEEIIKIESRGENLLMIGDANRHVGSIVPGNHQKTTVEGRLLIELLEEGNYVLINACEDLTHGGPFTRYDVGDPDNDNKKSVLDIVVVSKSLVRYI